MRVPDDAKMRTSGGRLTLAAMLFWRAGEIAGSLLLRRLSGTGTRCADDRLIQAGVTATTNPMGAGNWRHEYSDVLASAEVVIVTDADKPGYEHALAVQRSLREVDAS